MCALTDERARRLGISSPIWPLPPTKGGMDMKDHSDALGCCRSRVHGLDCRGSHCTQAIFVALCFVAIFTLPARSSAQVCHDGAWQPAEFCGYDARFSTGVAEMNHDCFVDYLDLALVWKQVGMTGTNLSADLNNDFIVDASDLSLFFITYGQTADPCTPGGMGTDSCAGSIALSFSSNPANIVSMITQGSPAIDTVFVVVNGWTGAQSLEYAVETSANIQILSHSSPYNVIRTCNPTAQQSYAAWSASTTYPGGPLVIASLFYYRLDSNPATFEIKPIAGCGAPMRIRWAEPAHDRSIDFSIVRNAGINGPPPPGQSTCAFQPPAVIIVVPAENDTVPWPQTTYDFSGVASDIDGTVDLVEYRLNGGGWNSASGTTSWSFTVTGLAIGSNLIEVRSQDNDGAYSGIDSRTITRLAAPDLQISDFSSPPSTIHGCDAIAVMFTVVNTGPGMAGPFSVALRWSPDIAITTGDPALGVFTFGGLGPAEDSTVSVNVVLISDGPRGDVYLGVIADDLMEVAESDENNNTSANAFSCPVPLVTSITDVGNDQGRQVRIVLQSSARDVGSSPNPILQYEAFRRIDPVPGPAMGATTTDLVSASTGVVGPIQLQQREERARLAGMVSDVGILASGWEFVGAIPAHQEGEYAMVAPTLADSTVDDGVYFSVFFMRAATADPGTYFDSCPDSGYSLDNLAPNVPLGFLASKGSGTNVNLQWQPNSEEDLRFYSLYRGSAAGFVPTVDNRIAQVTNTSHVDPNGTSVEAFYKLSATDFAGNESDFALVNPDLTDTDPRTGQPEVFAFMPMTSNPVRRLMIVRYDLPVATRVTLSVYDVRGRLVRTGLRDDERPAGSHTWRWNLVDNLGGRVAPGIYLQRFETPEYSRTLKVVVVRP